MRFVLVVLCVVGLALLAEAENRYFVGGRFVGADGFAVDGFAQYGWAPPAPRDENEFEPFPWAGRRWNRYVPGQSYIEDMVPVRDGVFAVGYSMVSYFDGTKWCPVRQPPEGSVQLTYCSDDSNCFVMGGFSSVSNSDVLTSGFLHYRWDPVSEEWLIEDDVQWSYSSGSSMLPSGTLTKLIGAGGTAQLPEYFFVLYGSGSQSLLRGSAFDGGWATYSYDLDNVEDYDIHNGEVYVTTGSSQSLEHYHGKFEVSDSIPAMNDWVPFLEGLNSSRFDSIDKIDVATDELIYFTGLYHADGPLGTNYRVFRWRPSAATVLGRPFDSVGAGNPFTHGIVVDPTDENSAIVWGNFHGANYWEDSEDDSATRPLNFVKGFARWNRDDKLWEEPFGGGIGEGGDSPNSMAYNSRTGSFYFANGHFEYVYDVQANGLAYFDEDIAQGDESLVNGVSGSWGGLLGRALWDRENQESGVVLAIAPSPRGDRVFFGGKFDFVGPKDFLGSVASARVGATTTEEAVQRVGGGLYNLNFDYSDVDPEKKAYLYAGSVLGLAIDKKNLWLYATGDFERGLVGQCLRNVARIKLSPRCDKVAQGADWEDVDGGCDGIVHAAVMYQGNLVVAGDFQRCGSKQVNNVAMLVNGQWTSLNSGLDDTATTLAVFRNALVVGGYFSSAGGLMTSGVAAWYDGRWYPLRSSCEGVCDWPLEGLETPAQPFGIEALTATNDYIYATGLELVDLGFENPFPPRSAVPSAKRSAVKLQREASTERTTEGQSKRFPFVEIPAIFRWVPSSKSGMEGYWHKLGAVTLGGKPEQRMPSNEGPARSLAHSGTVLVVPNAFDLYTFHEQKANFITSGDNVFDWDAVCAAVDDTS